VNPAEPAALEVEDAFWLGPALYVSPVVRRGMTTKDTWLPPGRFVDLDDLRVHEGGAMVTLDAPLGKLPLLLAAEQILPLLDPSIDTLAPATDPSVVTLDRVADRLDVRVALPAAGKASIELADGTVLEAARAPGDKGNPGGLAAVSAGQIADCAACFVTTSEGDVERLRVTTAMEAASAITIADVTLTVKGGPARRVRWDVLRLR
jgi:alpha-D-xyloside xylohydrolase